MNLRQCLKVKTKVVLLIVKFISQELPSGPGVKNPPFNAEDVGLIPGRGTKISHAIEQLRLHATTTEPTHHNYRVCVPLPKICMMQPSSHMPPLRPDAAK